MLIVDDSADSRSFCELMAQMFDVEVTQARNVDEAIKALDEGSEPDVVLLDLIMPGKLPEELVERVRGDLKLKATKVVIMSAIKEVSARAKKMGANASIRKPFTMLRFADVVGLVPGALSGSRSVRHFRRNSV